MADPATQPAEAAPYRSWWSKSTEKATENLVSALFVGAAITIWQAASSIDKKIAENSVRIEAGQKELRASVDVLTNELASLRAWSSHFQDLEKTCENQTADIQKLRAYIAESRPPLPGSKPPPVPTTWPTPARPPTIDVQQRESQRIEKNIFDKKQSRD